MVDISDFRVWIIVRQVDVGTVSFILRISGLQLHAAFFVQILPYFADMRVIEAVVALDLRFFVDGTQILHHDTELGQLAPRFHAL